MERRQLEEVEGALRAFAVGHGLAWVVQAVDGDVAAGVTESKRLRRSTRNNKTTYSEVEGQPVGRQRGEDFLTQRPMTVQERTTLLLSAIERAVVSTREIAAFTLTEFQSNDRLPYMSGMTFEPDLEFGQPADSRVDLNDVAMDPAVAELASTLRNLRSLIEE